MSRDAFDRARLSILRYAGKILGGLKSKHDELPDDLLEDFSMLYDKYRDLLSEDEVSEFDSLYDKFIAKDDPFREVSISIMSSPGATPFGVKSMAALHDSPFSRMVLDAKPEDVLGLVSGTYPHFSTPDEFYEDMLFVKDPYTKKMVKHIFSDEIDPEMVVLHSDGALYKASDGSIKMSAKQLESVMNALQNSTQLRKVFNERLDSYRSSK